MSRWNSPQAAAKDTERAAKQAEKLRKEKLKSRLMLIGVIVLLVAAVVADMLFIAYTRHSATTIISMAAVPTATRIRPCQDGSHEIQIQFFEAGARSRALCPRVAAGGRLLARLQLWRGSL